VAFWRAADRWRLEFKARLMPLKRGMRPDLILQKFKDHGVMELFTKCPELSEVDKRQAMIVSVVKVDVFGEYVEDDDEVSNAEEAAAR
jgi:hypothetical protein